VIKIGALAIIWEKYFWIATFTHTRSFRIPKIPVYVFWRARVTTVDAV